MSSESAASVYRLESPLLTSDPNSVANIGDVRVKHYHIDVTTQFQSQTFVGSVALTFRVVNPSGASRIALDVRDLAVKRAVFGGAQLPFEITPSPLGQALTVSFPSPLSAAQGDLVLQIDFETSPSASGLQWLPPAQTSDKLAPYLFSQFQAIHCRSFIPCQDTPTVKSTYSADVIVPSNLTALMSAISLSSSPVVCLFLLSFFSLFLFFLLFF